MDSYFSRVKTQQIDLMNLLIGKEEEINSIVSIQRKVFQKNECIYISGNHANKVYVIKKGRVNVEKNVKYTKTILKNVFSTGELFGESSLMGETYRTDIAVAKEKTELYIMGSEELCQRMQKNYNLNTYIMNLLGERLLQAEKKVESFVFKSARTRIIDFLNDLFKKKGQRIGYEMVVRTSYTHQEIANYTATSRQTVTTVFNDLRNKEILVFNRKRLLVRDMNLLITETS